MTQYIHETFESTDYRNHFSSSWRLGHRDAPTTSETRSGDQSLHVPLAAGDHYGMDATLDLADAGLADDPPQELYASYWVKFGAGFDMDGHSFACKLPGFQNHERRPSGSAGTPSDGTNGWAARGMFHNASGGVGLGYYCYHMDMSGSYGDMLRATTIADGEWHHIEQRLKLNTTRGGSANRDGVLAMWIDGDRHYHNDSMAFTNTPERGINYAFQVYYGGSSPSPANNDIYIDDWVLADERVGYPGPRSGVEDADVFVLSADAGEGESYEFTVDGTAQKRRHPPEESAEDYNAENDGITDNGDGTVTVTGMSSAGHADSFYVDGEFTDLSLDADLWTLYYAGEEVAPGDLVDDWTDTGDGDSDDGSGNGSAGDGSDDDSSDGSDNETGGDGSGSPDSGTGDSEDEQEPMDYDTITVDSGDTYSIHLGSGDVVENKLIDITADGAGVSIRANGSGWVLRNVGIKGTHDGSPSKLFVPSVSDGGTGLVEHCYFGDGTGRTGPNRQGGVWVNANTPHEGELIFRRFHVANWADNGLYGSGPVLQAGSRAGPVKIESSYAEDNNIANFRLGGDDSYVRSSVIVSDDPVSPVPNGRNSRGVWCKDGGDVLVENCDISMTGPDATSAVIASHGASATVRDCRVDGPLSGSVSTHNVSGAPDTTPPEGCPMTAEQAAAGVGHDGEAPPPSDDPTPEPEPAPEPPEDAVAFELWAADDAENVTATFTVNGEVTKRTHADDASADPNDTVSAGEDGEVVVETVAGNGYGDSYWVAGEVTSIDYDPAEWTLRWDGKEVTADDLVASDDSDGSDGDADGGDGDEESDTHRVTFRSPPRQETDQYKFIYYFEPEEVVDTEDIEDHEQFIEDWHGRTFVHGELFAGEFPDTYIIRGSIDDFHIPDGVTVEIDGEPVDDLGML